jgi:hypothetical protein
MLIHLPRETGYAIPRTKNGPALAGYGALTMKNALATTMVSLPEQLRRSLTWDRGKELSAHAAFTVETNIPVFFADPQSPWQRGSNEHQRALAPILPEGHGPFAMESRRDRGCCRHTQQQTSQSPWLEDSGRSPQRTPTIAT